jgi:signal transduction histidine kinase
MSNWQRYTRDHPRTADLMVAVALFAASFPGSLITSEGHIGPGDWWPGVLCTGLGCAALPALRRGHPRLTVVLTAAGALVVASLGYVATILMLGPLMVALYSLAYRTDRNTARIYAFASTVLLVATTLLRGPHDSSIGLQAVGLAACLLLSMALGTADRMRRAFLNAERARAEYAEHTREEEARHRVAEERMRIARELHDVVAHHMALANAQAGTAAHLLRSRPDQAAQILADLSGTTASALRELKATVGLLREADDPDAPLEPAPGLDRLSDLIVSLETAGLTVTITTEGTRQPLSPGVDLTAYRIVQEALTNVTKHAATRTANVWLAYTRDRLTITVTDEGGGSATDTPSRGFGLIGMRERAHSVGGHLQAGRRPEGGFNVTAELPLHPSGQEQEPAS